MVNNSTNINKNHLSPQLIEWWSTIPPISTKITSHFNSLSDGQQFHQYQQKSPLTSTHWVMVNNSTNINKNHLSPQLIEWWSTIPPISTKITSHLNSLSDGQQFHQYQQKSPLTWTHWVMVNNSTNINKNHLSPISTMVNNSHQQKSPLTSIHWWSTKITSRFNSLNDGQQFTNINKNYLNSFKLIEWWSTIPPISTKITSHLNSLSDGQQFHQYQQKSPLTFNSLSDGQQFHQYQQKSPLTSTHWVMVNNYHDGQQFHQYQQKSPLTSTHWVMVNNFHQYQQKSPLTSTHWVMVNNSTNINKNHLSPQLIEWWSTIPPISTKITSHINSLSDVNNYTNINKNHLSLQLIEWWSTIPPISTKITSHLNSLSDGQQFHQYQQKSPLTSTHWVMVNNSTNINKNHLSPKHIEWWSTIPPISTKITSHLNSLSDGQQFHQYQQKSPLTSTHWTHWVMVNNSTNINKNHLSPQLIEWWSTIPPISTKITSHINSLSDGQQFHQYQQKSPLTSTHWVMVNNSTNINKNHLSPKLIEWWSTIPPISTKITSHFNSLSDGQQFHQYQQKSPLTSTHWMMVNNSTNINKNHLSPQLIEWWSTIPPISTKITSHINSLSDGQQLHQYQQKSPLTSTHWMMVNNSTNINKNHLSPKLIEWWSTIPPISTKITSHFNSLSDGQQFHQYQQKSPLTSTHWVMVNNSTNINKNHLSLQLIEWWSTIPPISTKITSHLNHIEWWSTIPPISTKITSHLNSLSDGQQFHQYQQNHLSPQLIEWWSTIPPISTKITSHFNSLSDGQQFHQYQQKSPLTSTHWVMVNNSTNINKNHLSPQLIEWWSTIPPISTKITSHLNSLSDGQQFHQYQQKSPLTSTHWVMSIITPISTKITSHLNSLSDGQQFHQYQQKSPLT